MPDEDRKTQPPDSDDKSSGQSADRESKSDDALNLTEVRKGMTLMPVQPPPEAEIDDVGGLPPAEAPSEPTGDAAPGDDAGGKPATPQSDNGE